MFKGFIALDGSILSKEDAMNNPEKLGVTKSIL